MLLASILAQVFAQTLTTLARFNGSNGKWPEAGVTISGNTLYGTASQGGNLSLNSGDGYGAVFSLPLSGGSPTVLASFSFTNGANPYAGVTISGNTLYGTTNGGGPNGNNGYGTVFSLPLSGGIPKVLGAFTYSTGEWPDAGVTLNGSTLYGTTTYAGANNDGTVFSVPLSGGSPTVLTSFNFDNTQTGNGALTLVGNTLYGTAEQGGAYGDGVVFSVPTTGGSPTVLASFNGSNGDAPLGVTLIGNTLYGTTNVGGDLSLNNGYGVGVVFSVPLTGGSPTVLATFNGSNGQNPNAGLTLVGNTLYGTTTGGGAYGCGVVFSVPISGGGATVVASFNGSNGYGPNGGLAISSSTLYGTTWDDTVNSAGTVFALNIAPATIALSSGTSAMIIRGGTATLGMAVSNSPTSGYNLNYTLTAAVQSGSAALGTVTPASDSLAPGGSDSCSVAATSTTLGVTTISFTGSDPNSSNLSQTATATLTVMDHSNASLSSIANQTTQTINFGNVLRGAAIPSQTFAIYNRAANTSAAYTANLKLTGFSTRGDAALTTNLSTFGGLSAGGSNTFTASLNTANYTTSGLTTITMSGSQLADGSSLPGAGNNNNGGITVTLEANVGNATADMSNSQTSFGPALTAPVAQNGSYANLQSKAMATTGSGGYSMIGTSATILAGTNGSGSSQTVSMQWRTQTEAERTGPGLLGDVLDLSGMTFSGDQTSPFVLQMDFDANLLPGGAANEGLLASEGVADSGLAEPEYGHLGERRARQYRQQQRPFCRRRGMERRHDLGRLGYQHGQQYDLGGREPQQRLRQ